MPPPCRITAVIITDSEQPPIEGSLSKLYFAISVLLFIGLALSGYSVIVIGDSGETVVAIGDAQGDGERDEVKDKVAEDSEPTVEVPSTGSSGITLAESDDEDSLLSRLFEPLRRTGRPWPRSSCCLSAISSP